MLAIHNHIPWGVEKGMLQNLRRNGHSTIPSIKNDFKPLKKEPFYLSLTVLHKFIHIPHGSINRGN